MAESTEQKSRRNGRRWHKSAPDKVRRAYAGADRSAGWSQWCDYLAGRRQPVPLNDLAPRDGNMLLWAASAAGVDPETRRRILGLQWLVGESGSWSDAAESWSEATTTGPLDAAAALEAVAWARALPAAASTLDEATWWRLLDRLLELADEAAAGSDFPDRPLVQQLLGGELALSLAYLFPEIATCRRAAKSARKVLSAGMLELLDGEGLPNSRILDVFHPLLACWTRCRLVGERMEKGCCSTKAGYQYEWAIRAALRLSRADGSPALSLMDGEQDCMELLSAALSYGDEEDDAIAALVLPGRTAPKDLDEDLLPSPADHSAWGSIGVLQPTWRRGGPKLTTAYPDQSFGIELSLRREILLHGQWEPQVRLNGKTLQPESHWQELCWVSDEDIDYLELEIQLEGGARLQRHLAMARQDRFLFLADAVLDCPDGTIDYCGRLALAPEAGFSPSDETWDGFVVGENAAALVLPLALPEWRVEQTPGRLAAGSGCLEYELSGTGDALFAPLFVDLKPRRMARPFTWRRLTVAESLEIQPPHIAVGYRVMVGKSQWLIYRSLTPAANRTLLGHNLATEMLVARFDRQGEVEQLIEIEGDEA